MIGYDTFGKLAAGLSSRVVLSGRYSFQRDEIPGLAADVVAKLAPKPSSRVLEIGCNVGVLLTPIAAHVSEAVGMDHPQVLERYREAGLPRNVCLFAGQWPQDQPEGDFDRILVYSVIHYLLSTESAYRFIDACQEALRLGGRLLLGDIPNRDAKARFLGSPAGKRFSAEWSERKTRADVEDQAAARCFADLDHSSGAFLDDVFVLDILRRARRNGLEAYVLPQPSHLPFSHTREDLVIVKR